MTSVNIVKSQSLYGMLRKVILCARIAGSSLRPLFSQMIGPTIATATQVGLVAYYHTQFPNDPCLIPLMSATFISMRYWLLSLSKALGSTTPIIGKSKEPYPGSKLLILPEEISKEFASL